MRNGIIEFIKKETVLCAAIILAAVSVFFVPPDREYFTYIDFRTLAILFCLMSVMAGLQKIGLFKWIAKKLLSCVKGGCSLVLILVLLCFFSSMLITNDVALITFVPFTFTVLNMLGEDGKKRLLLPVVVMQTIAANLGSMLTPVGNPQNLYLFGRAGISISRFLLLMLPYTILSFILLTGWSLIQGSTYSKNLDLAAVTVEEEILFEKKTKYLLIVYFTLFFLCLLAVGHILPWQAVLLLVFVIIFVMDRQAITKVDYSLLFTFAGFFIFIGNVGRIPVFCEFLQEMIGGREVYTAIIASQVISNVPAALLLSGFTEDFSSLIIGTNLGGLGTLIASMASLISYKYVAKEARERKGKYIGLFTAGNVCFLAVLIILNILLR